MNMKKINVQNFAFFFAPYKYPSAIMLKVKRDKRNIFILFEVFCFIYKTYMTRCVDIPGDWEVVTPSTDRLSDEVTK